MLAGSLLSQHKSIAAYQRPLMQLALEPQMDDSFDQLPCGGVDLQMLMCTVVSGED